MSSSCFKFLVVSMSIFLCITGAAAQTLTTKYVTSTPAPSEVVIVTTACSATCPPTDTSGNALIESFSCGNTCLFCRWNWNTGAVTSPIGVAANPVRAAVTCSTSTSTSFIYPSRTTSVVTSTPTAGEVIIVTKTCASICPPTDNSGNALIASSNCGDNCLFCRWNWPGGNHFAEYYMDTGLVFSPVGVAANPSTAAVGCSTSTSTSFIYPSRTTAVATSTPSPGEIITTTTTCSSICPPQDNSANALIESFSCGTNCLFCRWNWAGGNHFAEYYVDTGIVFSPVGVAANPSVAAVACTTAASTSFLPTPTAPIPSGWSTAMACATDTPTHILTNSYLTTPSNTNTPSTCIQQCFSLGFTFAGVESGNACYCGSGLLSNVTAASISDCNVPCTGNANLICGATSRIQVYNTSLTPPSALIPANWKPYGTGCSTDTPDRVFANVASAGGSFAVTNTPAACIAHCENFNYTKAGVEFGSECYCGDDWNGAPPADTPMASCNTPCSGAPGTICGGPWAIQVYVSD
ncbi:hypothetical protein R3P38DRAFT_2838754 [Favolaschia claudopus]|uniref:WSC domain-containing protein n=1 Tax=Favolaschia claudopus TaxID=2862362 RepID=A0AAW0E5W3_9AGAR